MIVALPFLTLGTIHKILWEESAGFSGWHTDFVIHWDVSTQFLPILRWGVQILHAKIRK